MEENEIEQTQRNLEVTKQLAATIREKMAKMAEALDLVDMQVIQLEETLRRVKG